MADHDPDPPTRRIGSGALRHGHPHTHPPGQDLHHSLLKDGPAHRHWHDHPTIVDHHPVDPAADHDHLPDLDAADGDPADSS
jgi:hypothetical protein